MPRFEKAEKIAAYAENFVAATISKIRRSLKKFFNLYHQFYKN